MADVFNNTGQNARLIGTNSNDYLFSNFNTIETMEGGLGNDYCIVNPGDIVIEDLNSGNDTIRAFCNYTLADNVEVFMMLIISRTISLSRV